MTTGKPIGNMIINLDLNSSKLTRGLTGARNAVNYQMKAMKAQMQVMIFYKLYLNQKKN